MKRLAFAALGSVLLVTGCTLHDPYGPALPAPRRLWDNSPFVTEVAPPPELRYVSLPPKAPTPPSLVPRPDEWAQWQAAPTRRVCAGTGKHRKCGTVTRSVVEQANSAAVVKPAAGLLASSRSAMVRYDFDWRAHRIYEVHVGIISPTLILLPPGERLAVKMPVNSQYWVTKEIEMGEGEEREEAVVIRAEYADEEANSFLLFQSGLKILLRLIASENSGMLSVAWDVPRRTAKPPELAVDQRPPKIDTSRIHEAYHVEPTKKGIEPPWMPVGAFDDGRLTFLSLPDIAGSPAPVVFGLDQKGKTVLVQSRLYTRTDTPDAGSWLIVQGIHPALALKDSAGLQVKLIRQPPQPLAAQGSSHVH